MRATNGPAAAQTNSWSDASPGAQAQHAAGLLGRVLGAGDLAEDLLEGAALAGALAQLVEGAEGHQLALVDDGHAVADALDHVEQV